MDKGHWKLTFDNMSEGDIDSGVKEHIAEVIRNGGTSGEIYTPVEDYLCQDCGALFVDNGIYDFYDKGVVSIYCQNCGKENHLEGIDKPEDIECLRHSTGYEEKLINNEGETMTEKQFRDKLAELKTDMTNMFDQRINKIIKSGCVDLPSAEDNFILAKCFMVAFGREVEHQYKPLNKNHSSEINKIYDCM